MTVFAGGSGGLGLSSSWIDFSRSTSSALSKLVWANHVGIVATGGLNVWGIGATFVLIKCQTLVLTSFVSFSSSAQVF